jgi:glycosyltransferase involved in cell wall biosynthesis
LAKQVFCVSRSLRDAAVAEGLCLADKIQVILNGSGNGVDESSMRHALRARLDIPEDALVLGFVGRLVRDKGIREIAVAWQDLRREFVDSHLVIVGPIEPQDPVPERVLATLSADARVHMVGFAKAVDYYSIMDVLMFPSYREGFPNVLLEAAAMRVPVVASRIAGCVDAVEDGVTGTLVACRSAEELANATRAYLRDASLRSAHGQAGRTRVLRDFSQMKLWDALHTEYVKLLKTGEQETRVQPRSFGHLHRRPNV